MNTVLAKIRGWELLIVVFMLLFIGRYISFIPIRALSSSKPLELNNFIIYNYFVNAIILFLKLLTFSFFLIIGGAILNIKVSLRRMIKSNLWAYLVYFTPNIIFIIKGFSSDRGFNFSEVYNQSFLKFGNLFNFTDNNAFGKLFFNFNIFDILFFLFLIIVISNICDISKKESCKLVFFSILPIHLISPIFLLLLRGL